MTKRGGPKCGASVRGRDGTCELPAGWGTSHRGFGRCRKHLGNSPTVAKAAETARLEHELRETLIQLGAPLVEDPLLELQKLGGEALQWKQAIAAKVNELTSLRYEGEHAGEQLRAEVGLYERSLDRLERVLVSMARLNLDERLVRINEQQGQLIQAVLLGAIQDLGLPEEVQRALRPAIARRLRAAASGMRQPEPLALAPAAHGEV